MHEYVLTLLVAAAVTYLLTPVVRRLAIKAGAVPAARDRDVHAAPIPRLGGLAMYLGLAAGLLVASQMSWLGAAFSGTQLASGLLEAGGLIVIIGMIDDRWGIPNIAKFAGQVGAGVILVHSGVELTDFPAPHEAVYALTSNESLVLTILIVVATINAVNFIDGLDGLAAGIVGIAAISFFLYYYYLARTYQLGAEAVPALVSVILAGVCAGFLPHNFHPARIFMGDTGSMLLGLMLAYVPISAISTLDFTVFSSTPKVNRFAEVLPLLLPAAVMVIPYTDMLRAVVRRTRAGQSPFAADKLHLHHRMLDIGHSHRSSVLILYAWATLFSGTVVLQSILGTPLIVLAATSLGAVLILALLSIPSLRWWERDRGSENPAAAPSPAAASPVAASAVTARPVAVSRAAVSAAAFANGNASRPAPAPAPADAADIGERQRTQSPVTLPNDQSGQAPSAGAGGHADETMPLPAVRGSRASGSIIP